MTSELQTSTCGHAAHGITPVGEDAFAIVARNCVVDYHIPLDRLVCATCGAVVDEFDATLCEVVDEDGQEIETKE